jgi:hypothetical protein
MSRHAILDPITKKVINVILWDGAEWNPPKDTLIIHSPHADIGDEFDDKTESFFKSNGKWYHKDIDTEDYRHGRNPGRLTKEII